MAVPLSRGAALAKVLAGFYEQDWEKSRQVKAEEKARADALYEQQLNLGRQKALKQFEQELAEKAKPTEKDKAYADYLKAQTKDIRSKKDSRFKDIKSKLAKAYGEIDFMKKQHALEKLLYNIDKRQLKEKYGSTGMKGKEQDVLTNLRALEERLLRMRVTAKEMEDDNEIAYVDEQLARVRQRLQFFEKLDPVNQFYDKMSFMGPTLPQGISGAGGGVDTGGSSGEPGTLSKILDYGKKFFEKTGERPAEPNKPALLKDVEKVPKPKNWYFRLAPWKQEKKKATEADLDYLVYLASTGHPLYVDMYNRVKDKAEFAWYFGAK